MKKLILLLIAFISFTSFINAQNPSYSCRLTNAAKVSGNAYEFDLILQRTGITVLNLAMFQFGINIAPGIIPAGGIITVEPVAGSSEISNVAQQPTPDRFTFNAVNNCIRITAMTPPGYAAGSIITNHPNGTRLCRVRVSCSQPFNTGVSTAHAWSYSIATGYPTKIFAYVGTTNTDITVPASHLLTGVHNVTMQNTSPVDTCIAAFTYTDTPTHLVHFIDQSSTTTGTINSWNWVFTDVNTGSIVYSSNNYQNPNVQLAANGSYHVCLSTTSDSGCTTTHCENITVQDTSIITTQNPSYLCKLTNAAQVSGNAYEFDLILQRTGTNIFKLANFQFGINIAPGIIPAGGIITVEPVAGSSEISNVAQQPTPDRFTFNAVNNCIRITAMTPPGYAAGSIITNHPNGTRLCRVRVSCSQPFNTGVSTAHAWSYSIATGYPTKIFAYVGTTNTDITVPASHLLTGVHNVTMQNTSPVDTCIAAFTYTDTPTHLVHFIDQSSTTTGTINSWNWVFTDVNTGSTVYSTNNYQNPNVQLAANGSYHVCLTISSDSGCTTTHCGNIYIQDSVNTGNGSPSYLCKLTNAAQISGNAYEFDLILQRTGTNIFKLANFQFGINIAPGIIPAGGIITVEPVTGSSEISNTTQQPTPDRFTFDAVNNCIRITAMTPPGYANGSTITNLLPGTRLCRVRVSCSQPFNAGVSTAHAWSYSIATGYITKIFAYVGATPVPLNTDITVQASQVFTGVYNVTMQNTSPVDTCIAAFTYTDTPTHLVHFIDQSSTTTGTINSWNWVFTDVNTGSIVYSSNNYQNPYVQLAANGLYNVCLTISSDSGCTTTHCGNIYIQDSVNTGNGNPSYLCKLTNAAQVSGNAYEFDLILQRTGTNIFKLANFQFGINIAPGIIPAGGIITVEPVAGSSEISNVAQQPTPDRFSFNSTLNCIRITAMTPPGYANGSTITNLLPGTRLCRVRVSCSQPFNAGVSTAHAWSYSIATGYITKIFAYVGATPVPLNTDITVQASQVFTGVYNVTMQNTSPVDTCIAAFTYTDTPTHLVHFIDQSSTTTGTINSWNWVFTDVNTGSIVYSSNNYQNPYVQLAANELYNVCLTISSDSGCTTTHCGNIYIQDSSILSPQNPSYQCKLTNTTQVACNAYEFDVIMQRTGTTIFKLANFQFGINIAPGIIPAGGVISVAPVPGSSEISNVAQQPTPDRFSYNSALNCIRITAMPPPGYANGSTITNVAPGTRLCRVRVTCSQPFNTGVSTAHAWSFSIAAGYPTKVFAYVGTTPVPMNTDVTVQASHVFTGTYNVVTTDFNNYQQLAGITPSHGYAGSVVTATITGRFNNVTGIKLRKPTCPDIILPYFLNSGLSCGNEITSTFSLPNHLYGFYNLEVTTSDTTMILPNAFRIDTVAVVTQNVLFHENFDLPSNADSVTASGATFNFSINTRLHYSGTQCDSATVSPNGTAYLTTIPFTTLGYSNVILSFAHICKIEIPDRAKIQVSVDNGSNWITLDSAQYVNNGTSQFGSFNGFNYFNTATYPTDWLATNTIAKPNQSWWKNESFNIGALVGNHPSVMVRFALSDGNGNGAFFNQGWYIDNIKISSSDNPISQCQAYFTSSYNPSSDTLRLYDLSYNLDSSQINVNSWHWTLQYGGASYTYNTQYPVIPMNGYSGSIMACLSINTSGVLSCQSSFCDNITISNTPLPADTCVAVFYYHRDSLLNYAFNDLSYTNHGTINSWNWVITNVSTGVVVFSSNNYQNPVVPLSANNAYNVCLTMASDSGCTDTYCESLYVQDSNNTPCQLTVNSIVNHVSVMTGSDGSIDLTVTGGTPPYTYAWNTGATTQDIYNIPSGVYTVDISTTPVCPAYTYTYYILEPLDSNNIIVDTLYSPVIDTCLNFTVDSFYIAGITVLGNSVTVQWVFTGGGMMVTLYTTFTYSYFGSQVVILSVNCGAKNITQYTSYIYVSQAYSVTENTSGPEINLYPNPATDFLNITFSNPTSNSVSLKIFNTTGQQIYDKSFSGNTSQVGINVSELPSGVYFVYFDSGNGKPMVKKFLK